MSVRSGIGYDSHRLVEGRPLILGGVRLPDSGRGLEGHSDADALTHAIMDALLGAAGLGDIGGRYPDSDERWRGADSIELLRDVCASLAADGLAISHVDATVMCEAPRLAPWRAEMQARLSEAMGVAASAVNVKFTTAEGMGAIGRGEGIAALAMATLEAGAAHPREGG